LPSVGLSHSHCPPLCSSWFSSICAPSCCFIVSFALSLDVPIMVFVSLLLLSRSWSKVGWG
jgi:hypothetical protein